MGKSPICCSSKFEKLIGHFPHKGKSCKLIKKKNEIFASEKTFVFDFIKKFDQKKILILAVDSLSVLKRKKKEKFFQQLLAAAAISYVCYCVSRPTKNCVFLLSSSNQSKLSPSNYPFYLLLYLH